MRRSVSAVTLAATVTGMLVFPVVTPPSPDPEAVTPVVSILALSGVDAGALDRLQDEAAPGLRTAAVSPAAGTVSARPAAWSPSASASGDAVQPALAAAAPVPTPEELAAAAAAPDPTVLTAPMSTDDFRLVGLTWSAGEQDQDVAVLVRVREDGTWSDWEQLAAADDGPDAGTAEARSAAGRIGTDPLISPEGADGVQVRVDTRDGEAPEDLQVELVDPGASDADDSLEISPPPSTAHAAAPQIITRAQWGADETIARSSSWNSTVKAMIVHHTASSNDYSAATAAAQVRAIYAYHTKSLGWSDVGYHFLVDKFGRIYEGRRGSIDSLPRGAHTGGFNLDTMGVSALGNYDKASAPAVMVDAIARVTAWKLARYGVDPLGKVTLTSQGGGTSRYKAGETARIDTIAAHRDTGYTSCPGQYLNAKMPTIRNQVQSYLGLYTPSLDSPAVSTRSASYGEGSVSFTASLNQPVPWTVTVSAMCGSTPVRTFSGTSEQLAATWDLRTTAGTPAAPGIYRATYAAAGATWSTDVEVLPDLATAPSACRTNRMGGEDRYAASVAEGRAAYPTGRTVVLVSGVQENLVDGLVAAPLAVAKRAPMLMVQKDAVPSVVAQEIRRRGATTAYLVGGTGAMSATVQRQLAALGVTSVTRLSGKDRFATAAAVARAVGAPGGKAVIASGTSIVDAVAVSGAAARLGQPILLVSGLALPAATATAVRDLRVHDVKVIGGEGVIPAHVSNALRVTTRERISGADRYSTAAAIATEFGPLVGTESVVVASGAQRDLAYALAGGPLGKITLLVTEDWLPEPTKAWLTRTKPDAIAVLGPQAAVSTAIVRATDTAAR